MPSGDKLTVYLAVNTPLYAPVFLVKALNLEGLRDVLLIEKPPAPPQREVMDPLIAAALDNGAGARLAIGDPMRLTAFDVTNEAQAVVLAVLLDKMCFWVVDGMIPQGAHQDWRCYFARLLVHPPGYTCYTMMAHELIRAREQGLLQLSDDELRARLDHAHFDPENEDARYEQFKTQDRVGHVTTNPAYAYRESGKGAPRIHYKFHANYKDAVMTAVIGRANVPTAAKALRDRFIAALAQAIAFLRDEPYLAAYRLWEMQAAVRASQPVGALGFTNRMELAGVLTRLIDENVYNHNPQLKIRSEAVQNTCNYRERIAFLLSDAHAQTSLDVVRSMFVCLA